MSSPMKTDQMLKTLERHGTFQFVMDNITEILTLALEPKREEIENGIIPLGQIVEDLRQKIMLYLNDLMIKGILFDIPQFHISYTQGMNIFIEINPESFCRACGVDQGIVPIHTECGEAIH
jgi:hypothetical protein